MSRVVITGAEIISPIGNTLEEFFEGIKLSNKGISNIKGIDTSHFPTTLGAEVKKNGTAEIFDTTVDRKSIFMERVVDNLYNKLQWLNDIPSDQKQLNVGAGIDYIDLPNFAVENDKGSTNSQKHTTSTHQVIKDIANQHSITGGTLVNVTACVASSQAIGHSFRILKNSTEPKTLIAGGFESMLGHTHYMGFYKLGALSTWEGNPEEACKPFDKDRCGLVLGEGAVAMILQREEDADKNNILAEIVGYSSTCDSYMVTDPDPEGKYLAKAAIQAINEAGINPNDIDCVHLHGTGTRKNPIAEAKAMSIIFGKSYKEVPVYSMKGQIGHLIAACGAAEVLGAVFSLQNQVVPVTVNYQTPDPDVGLYVIKDNPLEKKINYVLKLNSAFGGQNTAIVLRKYEK